METKQYINLNRLYLLIKNDLSWLILISAGIVFFAALISERVLLSETQKLSLIILRTGFGAWIIGGLVITSASFRDLFYKKQGYFYLTLPASTQEKYFSKLIPTTVLWIFLMLVVYLLYIEVNAWLIGRPGLPFNPFRSDTWAPVWTPIKIYLVLQSVFFLGSIYFKKSPFLTTFSIVFVIQFFIMVITNMSHWILTNDIYDYRLESENLAFPVEIYIGYFFKPLAFMIPIFCWILAYIRLTESEV